MQNTFAHESGYFGLHDSTEALEGSFRNVADCASRQRLPSFRRSLIRVVF
jgi:hypothetical protein